MKTIQIKIPDAFGMSETELLHFIASKPYEDGKISLGQGAEMAGISKREFIENLGKYNVSVFGDSVEDLKSEIKNAENEYLDEIAVELSRELKANWWKENKHRFLNQ